LSQTSAIAGILLAQRPFAIRRPGTNGSEAAARATPIAASPPDEEVQASAARISSISTAKANPDEVKGSATGAQNFRHFGLARTGVRRSARPDIGDGAQSSRAFSRGRPPLDGDLIVAIVASFFLRETGHRQAPRSSAELPLQPSAKP